MTSKKAKYEILKTLGEGSYGRALLVRDRKDREQYVMKEVRLAALKQKDRDEALREAKVLASLKNPNIVQYKESVDENGFVSGAALSGKDSMWISVAGNEERMILLACYDNLGKGASSAAIENMNIAMGFDIDEAL